MHTLHHHTWLRISLIIPLPRISTALVKTKAALWREMVEIGGFIEPVGCVLGIGSWHVASETYAASLYLCLNYLKYEMQDQWVIPSIFIDEVSSGRGKANKILCWTNARIMASPWEWGWWWWFSRNFYCCSRAKAPLWEFYEYDEQQMTDRDRRWLRLESKTWATQDTDLNLDESRECLLEVQAPITTQSCGVSPLNRCENYSWQLAS